MVLECHESGPEIIVYLGLGTASILLVKSVIDLIITILKARQNESHFGTFKIIRRRQIKEEMEEEEIMELDLPLSEDNIKKLNEVVKENIS